MNKGGGNISNKSAKRSAQYIQKYVSHRRDAWGDMMRDSVVAKGQHAHDAAYHAWDLAIFLYNVVGDMFVDISIPGNFASGSDFKAKVDELDEKLEGGEAELAQEIARSGLAHPNLKAVLNEIQEMRSAIAEAKRKLLPATPTPAAAPATAQAPIAVLSADGFETVERIAVRFPAVAQRLRKRRKGNDPVLMQNEYDVQYVFLGLLEVAFDDVRAEEPGRSVAGGSQRADCYLIDEKTVVEFKRVRQDHTSAAVRKELADDFLLYGKEDRFENLFSFIYDPERVLNKVSFEKDLQDPVTGLKRVRIFVSQ